MEAAKCGCCGELVSDCVDCNYCNRIFCRVHWEQAVSERGKCPSCGHRCSSYDCHDNRAVQQLVDVIKAATTRADTPDQQPREQPPTRVYEEPAPRVYEDPPAPRVGRPSGRSPKSRERMRQVSGTERCEDVYGGDTALGDRGNTGMQDPGSSNRVPERPEKSVRAVSRAVEHESAQGFEIESCKPCEVVAQPTAYPTEQPTEYPTEEPSAPVAMEQCRGCGRKFKHDTLIKHEPKCMEKANGPKRKVFNSKKQILAGAILSIKRHPMFRYGFNAKS